MKKVLKLLGAFLLTTMLVVSCENPTYDFYPTTTIESINLKASAYPGVNILTWKSLKDAATYTVFRSTGKGDREEVVMDASSQTYYYDIAIDDDTEYKYRVVATPADLTVHDASQKEVTLRTGKISEDSTDKKGKWAPNSTSFLELAKYESNYNANDKVLSETAITAKLMSNSGSTVRVKFPTKPYAVYAVTLGQVGGINLNEINALDDTKLVYGYDCNGEATVDLTAVYSGRKEVAVTAIPLNSIYNSDTVISSELINVIDYDEISSATAIGVSAEWTNYNYSGTAYSRVYFIPNAYKDNVFAASEYTIYRSIIGSSGETLNDKLVYNSIEKLGTPKVDKTVLINNYPEYYFDDTVYLNSDVSKVKYYVVLNHEGKLKSESAVLTVPDTQDENWNYEPQTPPYQGYVSFEDVYIDLDGKINAQVSSYSGTPKLTYGVFSTYNQAEVAVEKELPNEITLEDGYGISSGIVESGKYYAFRLVSGNSGTNVLVKTMIAQAKTYEGLYYWNVRTGNPSNYTTTVSTPTISASKTKNTAGTKYNSITLEYLATSAHYYKIYRAISDYSMTPYDNEFTLLDSTDETIYIDDDNTLMDTNLNKYVFYKICAVGYYASAGTNTKTVSALMAPNVSLSGNELSWSSVSGATRYDIYRATSESDLENTSRYTTTTNTYYNTTISFSNDYYYAVKAYNGNAYEESSFSNVVLVEKGTVPTVSSLNVSSITFDGTSYTYNLEWDAPTSAYSNSYGVLVYSSASATLQDAVDYFETNPTATTTTFNRTYTVTSLPAGEKVYYAVRTSVTDSESSTTRYAVSNVVELTNIFSSESSITATVSNGEYSISWNEMTNATSYWVYCVSQPAETLVIDEVLSGEPTGTTTANGYSFTGTSIYGFFLVAGVDADGNVVGVTEPVRVTNDNINDGEWIISSSESYSFENESGTNDWISNNNGYHGTTASTTWVIMLVSAAEVEIPYSVSSESNYDKFTLVLDGITVVDGESGSITNIVSETLPAGVHTLTATYIKDSSQSSGDDKATVTLNSVTY